MALTGSILSLLVAVVETGGSGAAAAISDLVTEALGAAARAYDTSPVQLTVVGA